MKIWKFGKEENFLSQLGNRRFATFFGSDNFSKSKYIWGDGESWIWTEWTPKKALTDVKMSRKWPKLLFQPLRPPGASGGVNIENKSVQPVYIHTITPYFGQKSRFWMHLRGFLIGTTLPGHCEVVRFEQARCPLIFQIYRLYWSYLFGLRLMGLGSGESVGFFNRPLALTHYLGTLQTSKF